MSEVRLQTKSAINAAGAIVVAFKPPARSRIWVVCGDVDNEAQLSRSLRAPLEAVRPPAVKGVLALAIDCKFGSGGLPPKRFGLMALPREWVAAMKDKGGRILDDVLPIVWPD